MAPKIGYQACIQQCKDAVKDECRHANPMKQIAAQSQAETCGTHFVDKANQFIDQLERDGFIRIDGRSFSMQPGDIRNGAKVFSPVECRSFGSRIARDWCGTPPPFVPVPVPVPVPKKIPVPAPQGGGVVVPVPILIPMNPCLAHPEHPDCQPFPGT